MNTTATQGLSVLPQTGILQDVRAFLIDCEARRLSPTTVEPYGRELRYFRAWAEGQQVTTALAVAPDLLRRYLLHLGKTRNPGGQHIAFRVLKNLLPLVRA